jgi:hypothetical protein
MSYRKLTWAVLPAAAVVLGACTDLGTEPTASFAPSFTVSSNSVTPTFVAGNIPGAGSQVCMDQRVNPTGAEWLGFKIDPPVTGTTLGILHTISGSEGQYLAWSAPANVHVKAVLVKGGDDNNLYSYNPPALSGDAGLASPLNNGGQLPGISHFVICYTLETVPGEGCTPGFWKNRGITVGAWAEAGYNPTQTLSQVFAVPGSLNGLGATTLLAALDLPGGSGVAGGARNLLRAATAALLNAAHPGVDYELTAAEVISQVNAALTKGASSDAQWRNRMLALAATLDELNNAGCPLGAMTTE